MTWIALDRLLLDEHRTPLFLAPELDHASLRARALRLAGGLQARGVRRLALHLEDAGEMAVALLGAWRAGVAVLLPADLQAASRARLVDRLFDQYVMTPMQKLVLDCLRPADQRDAYGLAEAHALLEKTYAWLDSQLPEAGWAAGGRFGLADCAAAPALFYADWVQPIGPEHARLRALRQRLLARPSVARCVDEARPYRAYFPPGAPDRD